MTGTPARSILRASDRTRRGRVGFPKPGARSIIWRLICRLLAHRKKAGPQSGSANSSGQGRARDGAMNDRCTTRLPAGVPDRLSDRRIRTLTRVAGLQHFWSGSCQKDFGLDHARKRSEFDLVPYRSKSVHLSDQSGIESCRGRSIVLRRLLRRLPMHNFSRARMKSGARLPRIRPRVTHLALRHIEVSCRLASEGSSSILRSHTPPILERPLRRDGILELLAFCNEPMLREPFSPRSRCQGSLMVSHDSLTGRSI